MDDVETCRVSGIAAPKSGGKSDRWPKSERDREEISSLLGTWRTSTGSTKRFRSFDIPNSPRSCSFCRPSAPSPSAALRRRVFARGWDAQQTMLPTRVGAYWRLKKKTFSAILRAGWMSRSWKDPRSELPRSDAAKKTWSLSKVRKQCTFNITIILLFRYFIFYYNYIFFNNKILKYREIKHRVNIKLIRYFIKKKRENFFM